MKDPGRGEDPAPSAVVSGASASPSIPDLAPRNAAPALTSQPGEVAEDSRAEAARGSHGAAGPIALVDSNETIDPPISKISAPLPASVSATLHEHKPGVYAYGNDEMGYFYIAAEDVPVARAYVDNGGTGSARSSLTNSPMNPRAALGFSPFMPPTPHDSPGPIGHHYQPSPAGSVNGGAAAAHVNYAPSLAHGGSFLQYAAAAMATKGKQPASASTPSAPAPRSVDIPTPDAAAAAARAAREYESALQRWAAANNVPSDAALALPSTLMSPTQMPTQMYPYGMPGWHSPPSPNGYQPRPPSANRGSPIYPYHSNGGYGMVPIPPANVVSPPAYLNSGYVPGTDVRGDHYGLSGPPSHQPVTYNGGWAEEFPMLGARSARSSMNSAGSTNGGGPFISSKPSGKPPSSGGPRVSSAAADPNFRDALWRSAAAEAREVGDRLEIPPISAFDGADLADLFESSSDGVRFFVMKSHGEDDVHRSVRYGWWSSTQAGNARLDAAYRGVDEEEEEPEPEAESLGDLPKTLDESCGMDDLNRAFIVNAGTGTTREDTRETTMDDLAPDSSDISRASDDDDDDSQSPAGPLDVSAADGLPPRDPSKIDAVDDADRPTPRIILFFSVNCSGHFCGVAEMVGPVESLDASAPRDAHLRSDVDGGYHWRRSTPGALAGSGRGTVPPNGFSLADGRFRVRWHWVKDVPNTVLRHIRLVTGNEKPVTNSRDGQEVEPSQGAMVLSVFREFRGGSSLLLDDKSRAFYSMAGGYHTSRTAGKARAAAMGGGGGGRKPPLHSYPGSMVMAANPYQNFRAAMPGGYGGGYGAFPYAGPHHHPNTMNPYDGHHHMGGAVAAPFPLGAIASHAAASHGPRPPAPAPEFKFGENGPGLPAGIETNRT